uniref:Wsv447-like protein n=1 Tax=Chionoecetes opilio bacilliform virus TaxID=1825681 RepID=A0A1Q3DL09_9VIRU|nr:hypothetical protein SCV_097 [Chionoecetes opilio bacilliform virus]
MPTTSQVAASLMTTSTQQSLGVRFIRNEMVLSYSSYGGTNVYHLGGPPGAGKSAAVKELICELNQISMIDFFEIMLCSKTHAAKINLQDKCFGENGCIFPDICFSTLNAGFNIPVIRSKNDVTANMSTSAAQRLVGKTLDFLGTVQFLAVDEYTMLSCRELVYIDALFRMIKFRPDVHFGGVLVLLLGDNRQNSAVVQGERSGGGKKKKGQQKHVFPVGIEDESSRSSSITDNAFSDALLRILKDFSILFAGKGTLRLCLNSRILKLRGKLAVTTRANDELIELHEEHLMKKNKTKTEVPIEIKEPVKELDLDAFDDDDDMFFTDANLLNTVDGITSQVNNRPSFAERSRKIAAANMWYKKKNGEGDEIIGDYSSLCTLKNMTTTMLVEEGLNTELEHLLSLHRMSDSALVTYARDMFENIRSKSKAAMMEIDYTTREKLYVVSSLAERSNEVHLMSLANEEILNMKMQFGHDKLCTDIFPFSCNDNRSMSLAACVNNAFLRDGCDIKNETPIVIYFDKNLETLADFLKNDNLTYDNMMIKSLEIRQCLEKEQIIIAEHKTPADDYSDDDDDGYMNDGNDIQIISREDTPMGINADSTTHERVGTLVSFHQRWYKWLSCWGTVNDVPPSDRVRSRLWHLYLLIRMQQTKFNDESLPSFDRAATSRGLFFPTVTHWRTSTGEGEKGTTEYHDEFWLRALSMPVSLGNCAHNDVGLLLPAYSAHLSSTSRTYIISSIKRVEPAKHAYALMYAVSLFDMTSNVKDFIDIREPTSTCSPIGFEHEFNIDDYFGTIFKHLISEYIIRKEDDLINDAGVLDRVAGVDMKISYVFNLAAELRMDKKSTNLAACMLTTISKGRLMAIKRRCDTIDGSNEYQKQMKIRIVEKPSLAERVVAGCTNPKEKEEQLNDIIGAVALTRSHVQKNAISTLVDKTIIDQCSSKKGTSGPNSINSVKFTVTYTMSGVNVSYVSPSTHIRCRELGLIVRDIRSIVDKGNTYIDRITDMNLLRAQQSCQEFSKVILRIKEQITKSRSIHLFRGQGVVFTATNMRPFVHGTDQQFCTRDDGVVNDITYEEGVLKVKVRIQRLGDIILQEGIVFLGDIGTRQTGLRNVSVKYLPFESKQAMTIYSCQGQTFERDTIVDISGASTQDAYVAITRNSDLRNLHVVQHNESDQRNLINIKCSMGQDRSGIYSVGGIRTVGGEDMLDHASIHASQIICKDILSKTPNKMDCATLNPTRDMVATSERFILSRSGNVLSFNSKWVSNTVDILRKDGLEQELERINDFFFGIGNNQAVAEYYTKKSHIALMHLFTAVNRSVINFTLTSGTHIKYPNISLLTEHSKKFKGRSNYVKIHPALLNSPPREGTLDLLFYDIAPHSKTLMVMQTFAHFLFMVYERLHICKTQVAFLPSAAPIVNEHVRPVLKKTQTLPVSCSANIPGGLGYESIGFALAEDGGVRKTRNAVTVTDRLGDDIMTIRERTLMHQTEYNVGEAAKCVEVITKAMKSNLRRVGKYCRPSETCGTSRHGAVVIADVSTQGEHSHSHQSKKGWVSMSNEANMYGMLVFMTKLTAASGITSMNIKITMPDLLGNNGVFGHYKVQLSEDVLWCGQCVPMKRVQFTIHGRVTSGITIKKNIERILFGPAFHKIVLRDIQMGDTAKVLVITEMLGHVFGEHSTSKIRASILAGVGNVVACKKFTATRDNGPVLHRIEKFIMSQLENNELQRVAFFVSIGHV